MKGYSIQNPEGRRDFSLFYLENVALKQEQGTINNSHMKQQTTQINTNH
jgi:hypothetical protein